MVTTKVWNQVQKWTPFWSVDVPTTQKTFCLSAKSSVALTLLYDDTTIMLYDDTTITLYDDTTIMLYDDTTIMLYDDTTIMLYDDTTIIFDLLK